MQESLASEHGGELFGDALEELLDGGGVADESGGHLQAARRNITHGSLWAEKLGKERDSEENKMRK